ncbi:MAG: GAF domain-containing sensor histidine kinase [Bacteroidota bacterium]
MSTPFPIPANENERLEALASYNILDTLPEVDFEELTLLASQICQTPVALISLLDDKRQWFKSIIGADFRETPKEQAFCAHTIVGIDDIMIVSDAREDARFASNPLVTGNPNIVFYAGVPLINHNGYALGSLCVIDVEPKNLTAEQIKSLKILARQVLTQIELRKKVNELEVSNTRLLETNTFIQKFAITAAHDIKNPLSSILLTSQALQMRLNNTGDQKSRSLVGLTISASKRLLTLVDEMLNYSNEPALLLSDQRCLQLNKLLKSVVELIDVPHSVKVNFPKVEHTLICSSVALEQIFLNLLTNAVRYNNKQQGVVNIQFREEGDYYNFKISDNGIGIAEKNLQKIFEKAVTLDTLDRFNKKGNGLGLHTVKLLVEKLQGCIHVESQVDEGTVFVFSVKKNL